MTTDGHDASRSPVARGLTRGLTVASLSVVGLVASTMPAEPLRDRPQTVSQFLELGTRPRVIAHRGFSGHAPENTMAAFRAAIELGADMMELDVLLSRDGEVVVIHDETLERTTDGEGRVADFDLSELRRLDAGSWYAERFRGEHIPTLEEVLELANGQILLNVEIKTEAVTDEARGGIEEKVLDLIRRHEMNERVLLSSFDPRALAHSRQLDPGIPTASLYNRDLHRQLSPTQVMAEVGSAAFNISRRYVTRSIVDECHALSRPVAVYTVNEPKALELLMSLGVDAIFTDHPDQALEHLRFLDSQKKSP